MRWLYYCVVLTALLTGCRPRAVVPRPPSPPQSLDAGEIAVESPAAREWVGDQRIRVRRQPTSYRPTGALAVLQTEEPTDKTCRAMLGELIRRFDPDATIYYMRDVLAAKSDRVVVWVNRASGSFKYTRADASHALRSNIPRAQAIQTALDFVGKNRLVPRAAGEEIDLLDVSEVMNRVSRVGEERPLDEFRSDTYVAFGRRYQGIPLIGSRLVVRVDGKGNVVMVEADWRRLTVQSAERALTRREALDVLVTRSPEFRKRLAGAKGRPLRATILDAKCGYIEAPADYTQSRLRPGCQVLYRVGGRTEEEPSRMTIPLERDATAGDLLGRRFDGQAR